MEQTLNQLNQILQKLTGLHRQLLETVRNEREILIQANLKAIERTTASKQSLIEEIYQVESERLKVIAELAVIWKRPYRDLTLPNIIIHLQGIDLKKAEQFRSTYHVLTVLIQRISDQNTDNKAFLEKSISHIHQMKKNILNEVTPKSNTYNHQGQKSQTIQSSRLISKEA